MDSLKVSLLKCTTAPETLVMHRTTFLCLSLVPTLPKFGADTTSMTTIQSLQFHGTPLKHQKSLLVVIRKTNLSSLEKAKTGHSCQLLATTHRRPRNHLFRNHLFCSFSSPRDGAWYSGCGSLG